MKCENARHYYFACLTDASSVPQEIASHLSECAHCREEMDRLREALDQPQQSHQPESEFLALHYRLLDQWVSCETIKPLLPSLLAVGLSARNATPVTAHLDKCRQCQKNLDELASLKLTHSQLMAAARCLTGQAEMSAFDSAAQDLLKSLQSQRPSGLQTRMSLKSLPGETAEQQWLSDAYTIEVKRHTSPDSLNKPIGRRRAIQAFAGAGIAAAALLAVWVTVPPATVEALDITQLYQRLEQIKNAHIQVFSESGEEINTIWISESLRARLFRQETQTVFWNEHTGEIFRKQADAIELVSHGDVPQLSCPWGLLPFNHLSELPADRQWGYVKDTEIDGTAVQIYEMTWQQQGLRKTWRGYLDMHTHLPYRIEWTETIGNGFPSQQWVMKVSYPSDAECRQTFQHHGF